MEVQTASIDIKPTIHSLNGFKDAPLTVPNGQPRLADGLPPNGTAYETGNSAHNPHDDAEWPSLQDLEMELPQIHDGQVHVGLVMHQLVHDLYAQLTNIAETYVHHCDPYSAPLAFPRLVVTDSTGVYSQRWAISSEVLG